MDDVIQALAGGAGGLAGAALAVWWFVRHAVTKTIDQHFDRLGEVGKKQIELGHMAASAQVQMELAIYPAISVLVYRAKNATDAMRSAKRPTDLLNPDFMESLRTITAELRSWRIFLRADLFDLVHNYKHTLQDLNVIKDTVTRPSSPAWAAELPAETQEQIVRMCDAVATSCDQIMGELRKHMIDLRGPLST